VASYISVQNIYIWFAYRLTILLMNWAEWKYVFALAVIKIQEKSNFFILYILRC